MHKFMRAIGFSKLESHKRLQELLAEVVINADRRSVLKGKNDTLSGEFCKDFANGIGIAVCGEFARMCPWSAMRKRNPTQGYAMI